MTTPELLKIVRSLCADCRDLAQIANDMPLSTAASDQLCQAVMAKAISVERNLALLEPRSPVRHLDAVRDLEAAVERLKAVLR